MREKWFSSVIWMLLGDFKNLDQYTTREYSIYLSAKHQEFLDFVQL